MSTSYKKIIKLMKYIKICKTNFYNAFKQFLNKNQQKRQYIFNYIKSLNILEYFFFNPVEREGGISAYPGFEIAYRIV